MFTDFSGNFRTIVNNNNIVKLRDSQSNKRSIDFELYRRYFHIINKLSQLALANLYNFYRSVGRLSPANKLTPK